MKATEAKFPEFLKKSAQFVVPIYQRTYSWTEREARLCGQTGLKHERRLVPARAVLALEGRIPGDPSFEPLGSHHQELFLEKSDSRYRR